MTHYEKLIALLRDSLAELFVLEYRPKEDASEDEWDMAVADALGILISHHTHWDGERTAKMLIKALASGLEDANWHTEASVAYHWLDQLEAGTELRKLTGTWNKVPS